MRTSCAAILRAEKIRVVAEDLQGIYPRKVCFFPRTGKVMVKKLRRSRTRAWSNANRRSCGRAPKRAPSG